MFPEYVTLPSLPLPLAPPRLLLYVCLMCSFSRSFHGISGNMKLFLGILLLLFLIPVSALAGGGTPDYFPVAMRSFGVWHPETGERFDFCVWYPGGPGLPQNPGIKEGWMVDYTRRGRVIPGFYPVILVSHDTASGRYANNDLASALASGGFVVIVPAHNGDDQNNGTDMYTATMLRNRPRQLLRALETVLEDPDLSYYVDESRIGLLGIGFGSVTAMQLAGAKPDLSGLGKYCATYGNSDSFCGEWAFRRMSKAGADMHAMERAEGNQAFVPRVTLYAPELTPVAVPPEVIAMFESMNETPEKTGKQTVWHKLFAEDEDDSPVQKNDDHMQAQQQPSADTATAESAEAFPLELDFQGGPLFGGTSSGSPFVYIAMTDSPDFRAGVGETPSTDIILPENPQTTPDHSTVFRRLPNARQIKGVALMAPGGGMLFTPDSLGKVKAPVVMIQAGKDTLYPPDRHAQPFYNGLPAPPLVLRLATADHFSLFASCSEESASSIGEICGSLTGDERADVANERNHFLLNFFQSSVGMPMAPVKPSGYIAVPKENR